MTPCSSTRVLIPIVLAILLHALPSTLRIELESGSGVVRHNVHLGKARMYNVDISIEYSTF